MNQIVNDEYNLKVLEWLRDRMLYPWLIRVSGATTQNDSPAIAIEVL